MPCRVAGAFLCLFLFACLIPAPQGALAAAPDSSIIVAGNRHIDADMIRAHFHAASDGAFDATAIDAALKSLYATGLFADVKIERQGERILGQQKDQRRGLEEGRTIAIRRPAEPRPGAR
jgi:outer membrane protein insertion porin family